MLRTRTLIIGGGIAGCSVAARLAQLGWGDCILVEKDELASGSTWHAAGLCTQLHPSLGLARIAVRSVSICRELERQTPGGVGFHEVGSLRIATEPDQLIGYRRSVARARLLGVPAEVVDAATAARLWPLADMDGVLGGVHLSTDGHVDPSSLVQALVAAAEAQGVRVLRHTAVERVERLPDGAWLVTTSAEPIHAEIVVDAAGQDAARIARLVGGDLPLVPLQHQYLLTGPSATLQARAQELPCLRDASGSFYVRQEQESWLVGPFEPEPLLGPLDPGGVPPHRLLPPNLPQIEATLLRATERIPELEPLGIRRVVNGTDAYTPDGHPLLGPLPGQRNFYVVAGFSIFGIVLGPGAGAYTAEWIVAGEPTAELGEVDVSRFGPYAVEPGFLQARARDTYTREYATVYPFEERPAGRPLRQTPLRRRLAERGAVFGARGGWERPLWFRLAGDPADPPLTFGRPGWLARVTDEGRVVRRGVGLLEQTSFAKFEVHGPGAAALLDRAFANRVPRREGDVVVGQCLAESGAIACDITITRTARERFYVIAAAAAETHDLDWLTRAADGDPTVGIDRVTERYGVLTLAGPRSRDLLGRLCPQPLDDAAFPFRSAQVITVAGVELLALRLSFVGELGWELHHPVADSPQLYDALVDAGSDLGLRDFGYHALDALRLEKGYRMWGSDIGPPFTPLEADLEPFVRWGKGDFVGRDALARQRAEGVGRRLVSLVIEPGEGTPVEGDPVLQGDRALGYLTSAGYGPVVEEWIGLAYLPVGVSEPGTRLTVDVVGAARAATVVRPVRYDPENRRLRGGSQ